MKRLSLLMVPLLLALAACRPQAPDTERPPEPQATALRDAMKKDLDQAKAAAAAAEQASRPAPQPRSDGSRPLDVFA